MRRNEQRTIMITSDDRDMIFNGCWFADLFGGSLSITV